MVCQSSSAGGDGKGISSMFSEITDYILDFNQLMGKPQDPGGFSLSVPLAGDL